MKEAILEAIGEWLSSLYKKIIENPIRNLILLVVSIFIIFYMGQALYNSFGIITLIGYIFACIYGITKIVDNPERVLVWGVGFLIGADTASIIGCLVILYVVIALYIKSRELKNA